MEEYIYRCNKCERCWNSKIKDSTCPSCGSRNDVEFDVQYNLFEDYDDNK